MSFRVSGSLFLHLRLMRSCEISHENHLRELESYYRLNLTYGASERETAKQNLDHVSTKCAKMGGIISFYNVPRWEALNLFSLLRTTASPPRGAALQGSQFRGRPYYPYTSYRYGLTWKAVSRFIFMAVTCPGLQPFRLQHFC